ncbi:MAG: polysaccharide biosynthesis tyrosine autokinase [Planctomycetes bacterium]|nr:polysaccharide biosynthesis tyrosine autokinase [Planctomycetota bacterium]
MSLIATRDQTPQTGRQIGGAARPRPGAPQGLTGGDLLRIVRKRMWMILLILLLCIVSAGVTTWLWLAYSPLYTAEADLVVNPPSSELRDTAALRTDEVERFKLTIMQMAKSDLVLQAALNRNEVKATQWYLANRERLVTALFDAVSITPIRDTTLLRLSMTGSDPREVAEIINAWANAFVDETEKLSTADTNRTIQRLRNQRQGMVDDLAKISSNIERILASRADTAPNIAQKMALLTQEIKKVEVQHKEAEDEFNKAQGEKAALLEKEANGLLDTAPEVTVVYDYDALLRQLNAEHQQLRSAVAGAESRGIDKSHPSYKDLLARLEANERHIDARESLLREGQVARIKLSYDSAMMQAKTLMDRHKQALEAMRAESRDLNLSLKQVESETVKMKTIEANLGLVDRRLLELDLQSRASRPVQVQRPASTPEKPSMPRWSIMMPVGVLLGLVFGVGLAFLLEFIDTSIKSPSDVSKRLELPMLGFVPHADDLDEEINDIRLAFATNPHSVVGESFRQIRTCVQFSAPAEQLQSLLVTSAQPGDGRTAVAMNLAAAFARNGKKVLVVDANFRQPAMEKLFPQCQNTGLSNALVSQCLWSDHVCEIEPNLSVLPAGPLPPNPAELLGSDTMRLLVSEMVAQYDQVIIDGPPCLLVTDAAVMSSIADGTVLVVRATSNTFGVVQRSRDILNRVNARILGVVLNGIRVTAGGYLRKNYRTFYEYHEPQLSLENKEE